MSRPASGKLTIPDRPSGFFCRRVQRAPQSFVSVADGQTVAQRRQPSVRTMSLYESVGPSAARGDSFKAGVRGESVQQGRPLAARGLRQLDVPLRFARVEARFDGRTTAGERLGVRGGRANGLLLRMALVLTRRTLETSTS